MKLRAISSMATQHVLAQLISAFTKQTGGVVELEVMGGVIAAQRVQAGEDFDVVLLASDAIERLIASGHVQARSRVDWVQSSLAAAVPLLMSPSALAGKHIDISSVATLQQALLAAPSVSYSTGPSGDYLKQLFHNWGMSDAVNAKLIVPPPGIAVGSLLAQGNVALGFQQRSELIHVQGIQVLGDLPPGAAFITTFSAGVSVNVSLEKKLAVKQFLNFLNAPQTAAVKQGQAMSTIQKK